jgi:hypothetical protein
MAVGDKSYKKGDKSCQGTDNERHFLPFLVEERTIFGRVI